MTGIQLYGRALSLQVRTGASGSNVGGGASPRVPSSPIPGQLADNGNNPLYRTPVPMMPPVTPQMMRAALSKGMTYPLMQMGPNPMMMRMTTPSPVNQYHRSMSEADCSRLLQVNGQNHANNSGGMPAPGKLPSNSRFSAMQSGSPYPRDVQLTNRPHHDDNRRSSHSEEIEKNLRDLRHRHDMGNHGLNGDYNRPSPYQDPRRHHHRY